ncbi:hypothetical protein [Rothia sp. P5766]|uniref:hypothetical protein n=1 Tax=Rothia sp. P5766 TaxID=3402656 RepID=UPI003AE6F439
MNKGIHGNIVKVPSSYIATIAKLFLTALVGCSPSIARLAKKSSLSGQGDEQSYTAKMAGSTNHGVVRLMPAGTGSGYNTLIISADDTKRSKSYADTFATSTAEVF